MRWAIAAACLSVLAIGVAILVATPDMDRLPSGGRAIPYLGIALAWGFVGVGAFAWARRPDNRTGMLMTIVGLVTAVSGLQLFDEPVPFVLGSLADTTTAALLVHLLLAFPSGRLEGRAARWVVALGYIAAALQLPLVLVTDCADDGCPENLLLVTDNATSRPWWRACRVCSGWSRSWRPSCWCCDAGERRARRSGAGSSRCSCSAPRSSCSAWPSP